LVLVDVVLLPGAVGDEVGAVVGVDGGGVVAVEPGAVVVGDGVWLTSLRCWRW
jgi:hypothetical protein